MDSNAGTGFQAESARWVDQRALSFDPSHQFAKTGGATNRKRDFVSVQAEVAALACPSEDLDKGGIFRMYQFADCFGVPWRNMITRGIQNGAYWSAPKGCWLAARTGIPVTKKSNKFKEIIYQVHDWFHQHTPSLSPSNFDEREGVYWTTSQISGEIAVLAYTEFFFVADEVDRLWDEEQAASRLALPFLSKLQSPDVSEMADILYRLLVLGERPNWARSREAVAFLNDYQPMLDLDSRMIKRYWECISETKWSTNAPFVPDGSIDGRADVQRHIQNIRKAVEQTCIRDPYAAFENQRIRRSFPLPPWSTSNGNTRRVDIAPAVA